MNKLLIKLAMHYLEMSAMFMFLALSEDGSKKLETIKKVLEDDQRR